MEQWIDVRRAVMAEGVSKRAACKRFGIHGDTLKRILDHPSPPGYVRKLASEKSVIAPCRAGQIRSGLKTHGLVVGSIVIGFLVALLESLCTGQVYLPTIVFVARSPTMRGDAIAYLLFYNLMFILPLIGVFIVAYCGVSSDRLGRLLRGNLAIVKLAMALLFAALGVLVLTTI